MQHELECLILGSPAQPIEVLCAPHTHLVYKYRTTTMFVMH